MSEALGSQMRVLKLLCLERDRRQRRVELVGTRRCREARRTSGPEPLTFRRVFFWGMFALLTLGGVGAWFNELSRETGLWIELRDTWNWPPTLAKFGSLTGYVGMAFVASWITAMNVSWLVNEARAGYRRLRERRPKK